MAYFYKVDTRDIEISEKNELGHYHVTREQRPLGYIYVSDLNVDTVRPIWNGNTPALDGIAAEVGLYIEECDM